MRAFPLFRSCVLTAAALLGVSSSPARAAADSTPRAPNRPPNFVLIFCDDLGYSDVGCFGAQGFSTPNLDRMATEGVRMTNFYAPAAVCSPSRAGLLTGCYPPRVGITHVLFPNHNHGINADETTLPELLKSSGYATACIGKWHLGHHKQFLPPLHGFDVFFGIPYSNDMSPDPKNNPNPGQVYPPLPLIRGTETIETEPDQNHLTRRLTEEAVKFIETSKDKPFFLYLPHPQPHVPLYASEKFRGKTQRGLFGDSVEEVDWSVGQILETLKKHNLDDNTLVVFTSDNGPWAAKGDHGGSARPLTGSKGGHYEGASREPTIARWPGKIPAGSVCKEPAGAIDLLPTFARLAGAEVPEDRVIDGKDIWPLLSAQANAKSPHEAIYYYTGTALRAVRSGPWKLHLSAPAARKPLDKPLLFNLEADIAEKTNLADEHPDVVERLMGYAEKAREDLGDSLTNHEGKNIRPPGRVPESPTAAATR